MASISYNPNDADSIVSAVLRSMAGGGHAFKTSKSDKSDAIETFKELQHLCSDASAEERRGANRVFVDAKIPVFLYYVSVSDGLEAYQADKTQAIRTFIEKKLSDLTDTLTYYRIRSLITTNDLKKIEALADEGAPLVSRKVESEKYIDVVNDLDTANRTIDKLNGKISELKATITTLKAEIAELKKKPQKKASEDKS